MKSKLIEISLDARPRKRILIIGENALTETDSPLFPLPEDRTGGRLCALMGISPHNYIRHTTR